MTAYWVWTERDADYGLVWRAYVCKPRDIAVLRRVAAVIRENEDRLVGGYSFEPAKDGLDEAAVRTLTDYGGFDRVVNNHFPAEISEHHLPELQRIRSFDDIDWGVLHHMSFLTYPKGLPRGR